MTAHGHGEKHSTAEGEQEAIDEEWFAEAQGLVRDIYEGAGKYEPGTPAGEVDQTRARELEGASAAFSRKLDNEVARRTIVEMLETRQREVGAEPRA